MGERRPRKADLWGSTPQTGSRSNARWEYTSTSGRGREPSTGASRGRSRRSLVDLYLNRPGSTAGSAFKPRLKQADESTPMTVAPSGKMPMWPGTT